MTEKLPSLSGCTIAVIGLGYVGLPLLNAFFDLFKDNQSHYSGLHL